MELRKNLVIIVSMSVFSFLGCSILNNSKTKENKEITIDVVEEDDRYVIERSEQFFVLNQDGYMYYEDGDIIHSLYKKKYSNQYPNYHLFKIAVLNNNITPPLPKGMSRDGIVYDTDCRFLLDSIVMSDYKKLTLENFIEKYCHNIEYDRLVINNEYYDTQCTVAYCLWLTGNYILYRYYNSIYIDKNSTLNALYRLKNGVNSSTHSEAAEPSAK